MRSIVPSVQPARTVTSLSKTMYTAKAESTGGGRNGVTKLREEGPLKFQLALPKALGGSGEGQNPEQFFAMGYSACFLSALNSIARGQKYKLPEDVEVHADVSIGVPEGSKGFSLAVELIVKGSFPDSDKETVEKLVHEAHQIRNNIPVSVSVA
ncbi:hypothetical protein MBRA1_001852 [Malassezia brasiliensis]|uniref:OsmC-like protein n=1 Tax=Malassezia brasiliensis TaxID=1821822 RepID=A0AAF0IPQ6_9BASI|nr:hypothetical protein MBRA1_001852 [Malassezia brasiliensis]